MKLYKLNIKKSCCAIMIVVIIVIISPFIFTRPAICEWFNYSSTGEIGDTIGGTTAPIIGLLSVILLYITLKKQIQADECQGERLVEQEKIMRDEQFKSTFFNLLAEQRDLLHSLKATYNGLSLKDVTKQISAKVCGQEFFDMAIVELKFLFHSLELENYEPYDTEYAEELMQNVYDQCFRGEFLPEKLKKENEKNVRSAKRYINSLFFREIFNITKDDFLKYKEIKSESDKITFVYDKYFSKRENSGCYFRHLYRILSFIEDTEKQEIQEIQEIKKSNQNQQQIEKHYYEYAQFV